MPGGVDQADVAERLRGVADLAAGGRGRTPRRAGRRRCAGRAAARTAARLAGAAACRAARRPARRCRPGTRPRRRAARRRRRRRRAGSAAGSRRGTAPGRPRRRCRRTRGSSHGQEADPRDQQQRGVQPARAVELGEGVPVGVETLARRRRRGSSCAAAATGPPGRRGRTARTACDRPVDADPGHHLGVHEVPPRRRGPPTGRCPARASAPSRKSSSARCTPHASVGARTGRPRGRGAARRAPRPTRRAGTGRRRRCRPGPAASPRSRAASGSSYSGMPARAVEAVHDLQVGAGRRRPRAAASPARPGPRATNPVPSSACRVNVASRSQQNR